MAARKPPVVSISLKSPFPDRPKKYTWSVPTFSLLREVKDLYPEEFAAREFGQWEIAATAAASYGPTNYAGCTGWNAKIANATEEGREAIVQVAHTIWTGVKGPGVGLADDKVAELHRATQALWAEWIETPEGLEAMAKRAAKGSIVGEDPFASAAATGKAKAAGQDQTRGQRQLKAAESAVSSANARLADIRAKASGK